PTPQKPLPSFPARKAKDLAVALISSAAQVIANSSRSPWAPTPQSLFPAAPARPASLSHFPLAGPTPGSNRVIDTGDPDHQRSLSLIEIHEELEQEQEAQVNRMVRMIRSQQLHLDQIRMQYNSGSGQNSQRTCPTAVPDDLPETEACDIPQSNVIPSQLGSSPSKPSRRTSAYDTCANDSAPSPLLSHRNSRLKRGATHWSSRSIDDEIAFYEAEAVWLARENQMLRMRVRNLEKRIADMEPAATGCGRRSHDAGTPETPSPLLEAMHMR
ncbi:hypothetical protein LTR41_011922, partial [Exophiala xenobiotica]